MAYRNMTHSAKKDLFKAQLDHYGKSGVLRRAMKLIAEKTPVSVRRSDGSLQPCLLVSLHIKATLRWYDADRGKFLIKRVRSWHFIRQNLHLFADVCDDPVGPTDEADPDPEPNKAQT